MMAGKILLTGASGYLGTSLIPELVAGGYKPVALTREHAKCNFPSEVDVRSGNLSNEAFLADAFEDVNIVIHLGGLKNIIQCSNNLEEAIEANVSFTGRVLNMAGKRNAKIIYASTYWVYGPSSSLPYREDQVLMPAEPYGWLKAVAEKMVMSSGLNYTILRFANLFGFGSGIGFDEVVSLFLAKALKGDSLVLANKGKHSLDFFWINDACKALVKVLELKTADNILNVGSGIPITVAKLAASVNKISLALTGSEARIAEGTEETDEVLFADRWLDNSRMRELLQFTPTPLDRALKEFALTLMKEGI